MRRHGGSGPLRRAALLAGAPVAALGLLLAGCAAPAGPDGGPGLDAQPAAQAAAPAAPEAATVAPAPTPHPQLANLRAGRSHREVATPRTLRIPVLGVRSDLERLGRAADRTVEVPQDPDSVGWYAEGPRPGQAGPAVLLGHVDSRTGPAVFYRLHELRPGDEVVVDRDDGSSATFRVTRTEQHPKRDFPTESVYHPTLQPELRLVTCGGTVDPGTGHYRDNVIVFASLAG